MFTQQTPLIPHLKMRKLITGILLVACLSLSAQYNPYKHERGENVDTWMAIGVYGIIRVLFNGASSKLQVNETAAVTGDFGASDMGGFTLGSSGSGLSGWINAEFQEILIRKTAPSVSDEAEMYQYAKNKYSIT